MPPSCRHRWLSPILALVLALIQAHCAPGPAAESSRSSALREVPDGVEAAADAGQGPPDAQQAPPDETTPDETTATGPEDTQALADGQEPDPDTDLPEAPTPPASADAIGTLGSDTALDPETALDPNDAAGGSESPDLPGPLPVGAQPKWTVTATWPEGGGTWTLVWLPRPALDAGWTSSPQEAVVWTGTAQEWPIANALQLPDPPQGSGPMTLLARRGGTAGLGTVCAGQGLLWLPDSPPQALTLSISATATEPGQICPPLPTVLRQLQHVKPPSTTWGTGHFLSGLTAGGHLWVADSQSGPVRFDFGTPKPPQPFQDWTLYGEPPCYALAKAGPRLFCATRSPRVDVLTFDGTTSQQKAWESKVLPEAKGLEPPHFQGLTTRAGRVLLAARHLGLHGLSDQPPFAEKPQKLQPGAVPAPVDAWDVDAVGSQHLVVADGLGGLKILQQVQADTWQPVAHLPLPGRAYQVQVSGSLAAVAMLQDGVAVVDLQVPGQPVLRGARKLPGDVYGALVHQGHLLAAAGHHVVALQVPAAPGPLVVRDLRPAWKDFALGIVPFGQQILTTEFEAVRRFDLQPQASPQVVQAPVQAVARVTVVGLPIAATVTLHNLGPQPQTVQQAWLAEAPGVLQQVPGTWTIPPDGSLDLPVQVTKTVKGVLTHTLLLYLAGGAEPLRVPVVETAALQPGDPLPPLQWQPYGKPKQTLTQLLGGKPGVVLVASPSCPVAYLALVAAADALGPLLQSGKLAVVVLNPWDAPDKTEVLSLASPLPMLPLSQSIADNLAWSTVLDGALYQPNPWGPPMPIVYVVDGQGTLTLAQWGWQTQRVLAAVTAVLPPGPVP